MKIDDSFKKPGSVPFKWEIRPGVPKLQNPPTGHRHSGSEMQLHRKQKQFQKNQSPLTVSSPFPETPRKLKPPPAGLYLHPPLEPQTRSRSTPRKPSNRFGLQGITRPEVVSSAGCFPSPLGKFKNSVKRSPGHLRSIPEPDYYSDLEVSSRWSFSSRKSISISPLPSHFASIQSSPRPGKDANWAGFGLF